MADDIVFQIRAEDRTTGATREARRNLDRLDDAADDLGRELNQMDAAAQDAAEGIRGLGDRAKGLGSILGAVSVGAVGSFALELSSTALESKRLGEALGVSTGFVQGYALEYQRLGHTIEDVRADLVSFGRAQGEAEAGSVMMQDALALLGVTAEDTASKSMEDLFQQVHDLTNAVELSAEQFDALSVVIGEDAVAGFLAADDASTDFTDAQVENAAVVAEAWSDTWAAVRREATNALAAVIGLFRDDHSEQFGFVRDYLTNLHGRVSPAPTAGGPGRGAYLPATSGAVANFGGAHPLARYDDVRARGVNPGVFAGERGTQLNIRRDNIREAREQAEKDAEQARRQAERLAGEQRREAERLAREAEQEARRLAREEERTAREIARNQERLQREHDAFNRKVQQEQLAAAQQLLQETQRANRAVGGAFAATFANSVEGRQFEAEAERERLFFQSRILHERQRFTRGDIDQATLNRLIGDWNRILEETLQALRDRYTAAFFARGGNTTPIPDPVTGTAARPRVERPGPVNIYIEVGGGADGTDVVNEIQHAIDSGQIKV